MRRGRFLGALAAAGILSAPFAHAQASTTKARAVQPASAVGSIRITGLPGETSYDKAKAFEIKDWSFGATTGPLGTRGTPVPPPPPGGTCGQTPGSFSFVKVVDKASPKLQNAASARTPLQSVRVDTRTGSYQFSDCFIESYKPAPALSGDAKSTPMQETIVIHFKRCERIP